MMRNLRGKQSKNYSSRHHRCPKNLSFLYSFFRSGLLRPLSARGPSTPFAERAESEAPREAAGEVGSALTSGQLPNMGGTLHILPQPSCLRCLDFEFDFSAQRDWGRFWGVRFRVGRYLPVSW